MVTVRRRAAVALVPLVGWLAGCAEAREAPSASTETPPAVGEPATRPAAQPRSAWERCAAMLEVPTGRRGDLAVVEACAGVFRGRCRAALSALEPDHTVDDGYRVAQVCAAEYCPRGRGSWSERTVLCRPGLTLADATHGWQSFVRFGLHDVPGSDEYDRAAIGEQLGRALYPLVPVVARVDVVGGRTTLTLSGAESFVVPEHATADELGGFAAAARRRGADASGMAFYFRSRLTAEQRDAVGIALLRALILGSRDCERGGASGCPPPPPAPES